MLKLSDTVPRDNRGVYSDEAIASVISQKFPEFKIKVAKDGFSNSEINQIKESLEYQCIQKEIGRLQLLQESHLKLQNDFAKLQENYSNLRNDYTVLRAAKINLNNEQKQTVRQLQSSNEKYQGIINTKVWKVFNFWQKSMQEIMSGFSQKRERFATLWNSALKLWQLEGFFRSH